MKKFSLVVTNEILCEPIKIHARYLGYKTCDQTGKIKYFFNFCNDKSMSWDYHYHEEIICPSITLEEYFSLTPRDVGNNFVKLNDDYTAEILDGKIKVGCQTFSFETLEKLYDEVKKFELTNV